jgi:hypothetical protein
MNIAYQMTNFFNLPLSTFITYVYFLSQCNNVREDMNHKLSLQVAENKRLQAQLTKAQVDLQRISRVVENLATRTQLIEANTGMA